MPKSTKKALRKAIKSAKPAWVTPSRQRYINKIVNVAVKEALDKDAVWRNRIREEIEECPECNPPPNKWGEWLDRTTENVRCLFLGGTVRKL